MSLQLLNMSIDVPATHTKVASRLENYNFTDTYVEFITAVIFKYENAIPEPKHRQHRELQSHKQVQVICQQFQISPASITPLPLTIKGNPNYINHYAFRFIKQFNRPPSLV